MIEIALGVLVLLATAAILTGAGDTLGLSAGDLFPLLGYPGTGAIAAAGAILILRGAYRLARKRRTGNQHALRTRGLASVALLLVLVLTLAVPFLVEPLNLVKVGGFPLGFYMAAQGSLVALAILVFIFARIEGTIDAEEGIAEE